MHWYSLGIFLMFVLSDAVAFTLLPRQCGKELIRGRPSRSNKLKEISFFTSWRHSNDSGVFADTRKSLPFEPTKPLFSINMSPLKQYLQRDRMCCPQDTRAFQKEIFRIKEKQNYHMQMSQTIQ